MAFAIGYNVSKANELMANIVEAFKNLEIYTQQQWVPLKDKLRAHWVGEDEQDFEKKLVDRLLQLYESSYQLTASCVNTIAGLAQTWYEFQKTNTIDGGVSEFAGNLKPTIPVVTKNPQLLTFTPFTIDVNADRGLQSATSGSTIQASMSQFIGDIRTKTNGLFEEIQTNNAFFGEQTQTIKAYVEKVGYAIGEVTVAVKDMYDELSRLAFSSYTGATENVSTQFNEISGQVESSLDELGQSRWS